MIIEKNCRKETITFKEVPDSPAHLVSERGGYFCDKDVVILVYSKGSMKMDVRHQGVLKLSLDNHAEVVGIEMMLKKIYAKSPNSMKLLESLVEITR